MQSSKINFSLLLAFALTATVGFLDSVYLTTKYFVGTINCSVLSGCQQVLDSKYSAIFNIPIASLGVLYYLSIIFAVLLYFKYQHKLTSLYLKFIPSLGFVFTLWLVYLQIWVIKAICIYCMLSATSSTIIFIFSLLLFKNKKEITTEVN
ncbi:vitamin K epoxide reductase family protein [Candidatus Nomurabacteria bacterium]|nr:vitamin K epoxide reductase family protein [Candidatus Nomurabacteria bacterium]